LSTPEIRAASEEFRSRQPGDSIAALFFFRLPTPAIAFMKICETEAFILQTRDYGESDRLVDFYTRRTGRLRGLAKGARRSRKRFVHVFEPCSLVELTYRERKSLIWIDSCKLIEPNLALRMDLERWGYAALISELVLDMAPEGESQEELFSLLKAALEQLTVSRNTRNVFLLFAFRFLDRMGYLPAMDRCSECNRPLNAGVKWGWRMEQGVLLCSEHGIASLGFLRLDLGTLLLIDKSRRLSLPMIWRMRFHHERMAPLFRALVDGVQKYIGKELKSLRVLEQLRMERPGEILEEPTWNG
jgi:DNA repair protein RecO (recombination protein O)